jgi:hypothetical protein
MRLCGKQRKFREASVDHSLCSSRVDPTLFEVRTPTRAAIAVIQLHTTQRRYSHLNQAINLSAADTSVSILERHLVAYSLRMP